MKVINRIKAVTYKECIELIRDRVTFGMVVMLPLVQLILFGYAINTTVRHIPVAVVDQASSAFSHLLIDSISATQVVDFKERFSTVEDAMQAITDGKVRAALIIPHDLMNRYAKKLVAASQDGETPQFEYSLDQPIGQWVVDGSDTTIASAVKQLRNMPMINLSDYPKNQTSATFEVVQFYNPEQRSAVNIVPGIVGIILTMTMIMFTAISIVREQEKGNLELLITTPIRSIELMIGKIIPYVFVGLVQMGIIIGAGHLFFNVPINGSMWQLLLVTLLFISASLVLGLILSTIAKTQMQAMQLTFFILLPSILLSGFMFPYEGMPAAAQWIAEMLPATHFMRLVRGVVLRDADVMGMMNDSLWLLGFTIIGLAVASFRFKKSLD
ncbi:ABC transporter permease [uncultured Shewanella sp.]|uniref:ABC transporter permease n=1 Tax=uncultured Shewanella sp. TaxID=173975 RepID=UPI00262DA7E1|nr:ABC transporter permease [uncultured Shewanella sp.]